MAKKILKITSVSFRSCVNIGPYQTAHVEATAVVGPRELAHDVLERLKEFVAEELTVAKEGKVVLKTVEDRTGRFRDQLNHNSKNSRW